jgi:tetratricopeptide (TPR) repeat protein
VTPAGLAVPALVLLLASQAAAQVDPGAAGAETPPAAQPRPDPITPPVPQPPATPTRALELHDRAQELYAKGKYDEAIAALNEALELDPDAKVLHYNLGLIHEKKGDLDAALSDFKHCLELEQNPAERLQLARIIKRLQGARRYKAFDAGTPAPRRASKPQVINVRHGVSNWVWVTGGLALASFTTAAILAAQASSVHPGNDAMTGGDVSIESLQRDADSAHALAVGADVMLAVGVLASAATLTIAIVSAETNVEAAWRVELGPSHSGISWRF